MRITRFLDEQGNTKLGHDLGDGRADVFRSDDLFDGELTATGQIVDVATPLAPIEPINIFCIGLNYRQHANETGADIPTQPVVFMKPTSAVTDPGKPIVIPACCTRGDEVDYEVELAVLIGKIGRNISVDAAWDHVFGVTVANDVSARRWQKNSGGGQWIRGKSFDTFCPLGPVLVTPDELANRDDLALTTTLNGQVMQDSRTSDMIFPVAELIAFISQDTTLLPGTVILTGTPQGVGVARKPPVFMQPGDTVTVAIDGIGELTNPVVGA